MPSYRFGEHCLDTDQRELRRGDELIAVEPQVFDLLAHLIEHRERVVTKDELLDTIWAGRVVSESTLTSRVNAARVAVGDTGAAQALIRTYARKGFRFIGDVRSGPAPSESRPLPSAAADGGRPCIAVLPFANLSSDPEQDYFSDGITEDLITALARHRTLAVIARNSSFAVGGPGSDPRQIGRDLGARYLVQGSVRRAAGRVRISAQLVDTGAAMQIWAEQYDVGLAEVFDTQDDIVARITARLEPEVALAEQLRADRRPPQSFDAWDHFRVGTRHFYSATSVGNGAAQQHFRRAIELDPAFAEAHAFLAYAIVLSMVYFDAPPTAERLDEAVALGQRAVGLDERDAHVRFMYGRALLACGRYDAALDELQAAAQLNPNLAVVHCGLGDTLAYGGRVAEAMPHFQRAVGLSPHDPLRWAFYAYGALAHLIGRNFTAADEWARRATRVPNCHFWGYAHRVAALGHLQRAGEAAHALNELLRLKPDFSCSLARERLFYLKHPDQVTLYLDGLRRAAVPET